MFRNLIISILAIFIYTELSSKCLSVPKKRTIDKAGLYCFEKDLEIESNTGITINQSAVTLDLKGFSIVAKPGNKKFVNGIKIRKGDKVIVTVGKSKGTVGEVLKVLPSENKALVRGANMVKRHTKPSQNSAGGIIEKEAMLNISNIAFYDEKKQKSSKLGFKILDDGRKVRVSKLTNEVIDK